MLLVTTVLRIYQTRVVAEIRLVNLVYPQLTQFYIVHLESRFILFATDPYLDIINNHNNKMLTLFLFVILEAVSSGGMVIQSHWSHVRLKSIPPARVDGRQGGEVVLRCSATGSPTPRIAWYKDSMFVSHLDWSVEEDVSSIGEAVAQITIPCLSASDAGVYECRARSGENEASSTTRLNVLPPDEDVQGHCVETGRPKISMWKGTYMIEEGDTARLPCRVQNDVLDYRVTWTNTEGKLAHENDVRYSVEANGDLVIKEVNFADMGQYTCTVSGIGGSDTVHTFMYPLSADRNLT